MEKAQENLPSKSGCLMPRKPGLQPYHRVWLSCHPGRTEQWLKERLADGFHIHHADGDHSNDDPNNLIMIEGIDHMLIVHGHKVAGVFTSERAREMSKKRWSVMTPAQRKRLARKAGRASGKARRKRASAEGALLASVEQAASVNAAKTAIAKA